MADAILGNLTGNVNAEGNKSYLNRLFEALYNSKANVPGRIKGMPETDFANLQQTFLKNPMSVEKIPTFGDATGSAFGNTMRLIGANIKAHPWQAAGTGLNAAAFGAGLLDNDKVVGQLLGTAAGIAIPKAFNMKLGPLAALNTAMAAGGVGSLFDTLLAAKEKKQREAQYVQQEY